MVLFDALARFPPFGEFIPWSCLNATVALRSERGAEVEPQEVERHVRAMWDVDSLVCGTGPPPTMPVLPRDACVSRTSVLWKRCQVSCALSMRLAHFI